MPPPEPPCGPSVTNELLLMIRFVIWVADGLNCTPKPFGGPPVKLRIVQLSMISVRPATKRMPLRLFEPTGPPSITRPRTMTTQLGSLTQLTVIPLVPATRMPASPMPSLASVIAFVTVTPPKPPGSCVSISPPAAVLEIAPEKVLHGAVREQGLTSSPTPEIHVLVACALAGDTKVIAAITAAANMPENRITFIMGISPTERRARRAHARMVYQIALRRSCRAKILSQRLKLINSMNRQRPP